MTMVLVALGLYLALARQFRRRTVASRSLVLVPIVLLGLGVQGVLHGDPNTVAVESLLVGGGVAVVLGAARGASERVWNEDDTWFRQGTKRTALLWLASIAARVAVAAGARALGGHVDLITDVELALGISLAAQHLVIARRAGLLSELRPSPETA
jgi:hypothetical protein